MTYRIHYELKSEGWMKRHTVDVPAANTVVANQEFFARYEKGAVVITRTERLP